MQREHLGSRLGFILLSAGCAIGIGCAIEKGFQDGGDSLRRDGYPLKSLAIIEKADENGFEFRKQ